MDIPDSCSVIRNIMVLLRVGYANLVFACMGVDVYGCVWEELCNALWTSMCMVRFKAATIGFLFTISLRGRCFGGINLCMHENVGEFGCTCICVHVHVYVHVCNCMCFIVGA